MFKTRTSSIFLLLLTLLSSAFANEAEKKTFTVAFAQDTLANDWRLAQVRQLEDAFKHYSNIRFIYTDGEGDTSKQIYDINNLIHQDIDLLITSPRNSTIMTPIINEVYKKMPVVLVTRRIDNDEFTAVVSPDDYDIARQAAHELARALNNKGKVLILRGIPTATTAIKRQQGFLDTLKEHYPDIIVSSIKDGNYLRADAIHAINQALEEKTEFDAIYAHSDSMATGARIALKHANIDVKSKIIIGIDYISEARQAIINNEQYASFLYPTCARETAEVVLRILNNQAFDKENTVESLLINKENVQQIEPIF